MYSHEIDCYLRDKNYLLNSDELLDIIDVRVNTQIKEIKYNTFDDSYEIWTYDGWYWKFKCKPYTLTLRRK